MTQGQDAQTETRDERKDELMRLKFDYAWRYFALHARQRVVMFNFFLLGSSFLASGYGLLIREQFYWHAAVVAIVGVLVGVISFLLDYRNHQLVGLGEQALKSVEQEYLVGNPEGQPPQYAIMSLEAHSGEPAGWQKHKTLIRTLEVCATAVFVLAAFYAIWMALPCQCSPS